MCASEGREGIKVRVRSLDSRERMIVGIETLSKAKNLTHKFRTLTPPMKSIPESLANQVSPGRLTLSASIDIHTVVYLITLSSRIFLISGALLSYNPLLIRIIKVLLAWRSSTTNKDVQ